MDNGPAVEKVDEEVVVGWVDKVFEAMPSCAERCHLMYGAKQGARRRTVIMMLMPIVNTMLLLLIASFRLTVSAFHNSIVWERANEF